MIDRISSKGDEIAHAWSSTALLLYGKRSSQMKGSRKKDSGTLVKMSQKRDKHTSLVIVAVVDGLL